MVAGMISDKLQSDIEVPGSYTKTSSQIHCKQFDLHSSNELSTPLFGH